MGFVTNRLSEEQQQQSAHVKNAHIKRLDNNSDASKVQLPDGNLSRSISHSFLPDSPNTAISRQQMLDSSPKISKASSKLALISRRSSHSSSREGSQERK